MSAFFVQDLFRPGYDPLKYPVSSLSIGPYGWMQKGSFLLTGILFIAYSPGLFYVLKSFPAGRWIAVLVALAGTGLIGAGFFSTDAVFGYPPNEPLHLEQFSVHGKLHNGVSIFVFFGIPVACLLMRKIFLLYQERKWAFYCLLTSITMLLCFFLSGMSFKRLTGLADYAGLIQRICIVDGWLWLAVMAVFFLHISKPDSSTNCLPRTNIKAKDC